MATKQSFTADNVPYAGISVNGVTFTIRQAYQKQVLEEDAQGNEVVKELLSYQADVIMPDGSVQRGVGWDTVKGDPDWTTEAMLAATTHAKARLTAVGATNIQEA